MVFSNAFRDTFSVLAICLISSLVIFSRLDKTEFHGDESGWVYAAYYHTGLVVNRDFEVEKWECEPCGPWGALNMQLGKFLIGIPLWLDPSTRNQTFDRLYQFDASREKNLAQGRVPPRDILVRARTSSAVFGILCTLLIFAIGMLAYNWWVGMIAFAMLITNEQFLRYSTRAMTDIHYNFFLLALCFVLLLLSRTFPHRKVIWVAGICGLIAGLAASVKVTGIVLGGIMFIAIAFLFLRRKELTARKFVISCIVFSLSSVIVIYALNPYLWISSQDLDGSKITRELRTLTTDFKKREFKFQGARERYPTVYAVFKFPLMFPRWNRLMDTQIDMAAWPGNRLVSLHKRLFWEYASFPFELIFFAFGLLLYIPYFRNRFREPNASNIPALIPMLWFAVNYVFILLFLRLNWGRYYLPTVIAVQMLAALGLYSLGDLLRRLKRSKTLVEQ